MKHCTHCQAELSTAALLAGICPHCKHAVQREDGGQAMVTPSEIDDSPVDDTASDLASNMHTVDLGKNEDELGKNGEVAPKVPTSDVMDTEHGDTLDVGATWDTGDVRSQDSDEVCESEEVAEPSSARPTKAGHETADLPDELNAPGGTVDLQSDRTFVMDADAGASGSSDHRPDATANIDGDAFTANETIETWGRAVGNATAQMTIKGATPSTDQPTATPSIQPRALRPPGDPQEMEELGDADYDLIDLLGEGGMGVVYNARQASIDRTVAIKMLKRKSTDQAQEHKFLAEAVVTGELDHPNIVPIYDLGRSADGALFYSMKKVQGTPWMEVIQEKSLAENLDILLNVADAVAFAHSRGVVHRDLKPENVMLGEYGEVLVLDWGLAIPTSECKKAPTLSGSIGMGGTPCYMAPEMVTGPMDTIGPHSDVYLLGAMLFECITGNPPHTGKNALACIAAAGRNEIVATKHTGELIDIAMRAMATPPEERFPTVQALQAAIRDYQSHSESIALSSRAAKELAEAEETDVYSDYARALYVFQEAFELWDKNTQARQGIAKAQRAYASAALRKGDFELGLSILDKEDASHEKLRTRLTQALNDRETRNRRMRNMKRAVFALAAMVFLAVTVGMVLFRLEQRKAEANEKLAKQNEIQAEANEKRANKNKIQAEENAALANKNKIQAEDNAARADNERKAAQYESYVASIRLAKRRIGENALKEARDTLSDDDFRPYSSAWEMRRLQYLVDLSQWDFRSDAKFESIAVAETGTLVAVGDDTGTVRILDAANGDETHQQPFPGVSITALAFSPTDSTILAIGCNATQDNLHLWDFATNDEPRRLNGHTDDVTDVEFSRDGQVLLSASLDRTARLWKTVEGQPIGTPLKGHTSGVWSAVFSPNQSKQQIATASDDGTVRIWEKAHGQFKQRFDEGRVMPFRGHRGPVYTAIFSADGKAVISGDKDSRVLIWRPQDLRAFDYQRLVSVESSAPVRQDYVELMGHRGPVRTLAYVSLPRSRSAGHEDEPVGRIVSASEDNSINVWSCQGKLLQTLRGHSGAVTDLAISPIDPTRLFSASHDKGVRSWNLGEYVERRELRGHTAAVLSSEFSPNGEQVVTASEDGTARIWNAKDGTLLRTLREGHPYLTSMAEFIPGTQQLLTAGRDGTARIWDRLTGAELLTLDGTGSAAAAAVSPDGAWIATGCDLSSLATVAADEDTGCEFMMIAERNAQQGNTTERFARIWDARTGEPLSRFGGHRGHITAVAFSTNSRWLFTGDAKGTFQLWDTDTKQKVATVRRHTRRITAAAFADQDRLLVTSSEDRTVAIWTLAELSRGAATSEPPSYQERTLPHPAAVTSLATVNDQQLLTGCKDGVVRLWDLAGSSRDPIWTWAVPRVDTGQGVTIDEARSQIVVSSVDVNEEGKLALVLDSRQASAAHPKPVVYLLDLTKGRELQRRRLDVPASSASFTPDGEGVVAAGGDVAMLWRNAWPTQAGVPGERMAQAFGFGPHHKVVDASYAPDGNWIVTAGKDGSARIWDAETGLARLNLGPLVAGKRGSHQGAVHSAVFSPDGGHVLTAGADHTVRIWNATSGEVEQVFSGHQGEVMSANYSPDGSQVVSASRDATAAVWLTNDATEPPLLLTGHTDAVLTAVFSPNDGTPNDGTRIVTGSDDYSIRMWDATTGEQEFGEQIGGEPMADEAVESSRPRTFPQQTAPVTCVAYSPAGDRIITACADRKLKVWDAQTHREILTLEGHEREVTSVAFSSADGLNVVSSGSEGVAIIWPGADEKSTSGP